MTTEVLDADAAEPTGFRLTLDNFDGPFDLLLGLIAKRRMDVTAVALAEVTDEFLAYVRTLDARKALDESSNFVFVAATLLDMKLVQLLPGAEPESEEDLAALEARDLLFARLLQYRAFKRIAGHIGQAVGGNAGRFPRRPGEDPQLAGLMPELKLTTTAGDLRALAEKAFARRAAEPDDVRLGHLHATVDSAAEKQHMAELLRATGQASFAELIADAESQLVVVVRFLGLLELFRDRQVNLDQPAPLGELTVAWAAEESAVQGSAAGEEQA
ncbi:segregation and condensation protein A [Nesterenkonia populi]|uniref:segregation and condensation protein A n=1 Tax=Nesterenkonia populi TaxID=1591087 RepID=UPI0011BE13F3|nr:ScpA family protein [Nesterenkonia populi]